MRDAKELFEALMRGQLPLPMVLAIGSGCVLFGTLLVLAVAL